MERFFPILIVQFPERHAIPMIICHQSLWTSCTSGLVMRSIVHLPITLFPFQFNNNTVQRLAAYVRSHGKGLVALQPNGGHTTATKHQCCQHNCHTPFCVRVLCVCMTLLPMSLLAQARRLHHCTPVMLWSQAPVTQSCVKPTPISPLCSYCFGLVCALVCTCMWALPFAAPG